MVSHWKWFGTGVADLLGSFLCLFWSLQRDHGRLPEHTCHRKGTKLDIVCFNHMLCRRINQHFLINPRQHSWLWCLTGDIRRGEHHIQIWSGCDARLANRNGDHTWPSNGAGSQFFTQMLSQIFYSLQPILIQYCMILSADKFLTQLLWLRKPLAWSMASLLKEIQERATRVPFLTTGGCSHNNFRHTRQWQRKWSRPFWSLWRPWRESSGKICCEVHGEHKLGSSINCLHQTSSKRGCRACMAFKFI